MDIFLVWIKFDNNGGWQELGLLPMFEEQKQQLEEDVQPVLASAALELSDTEAANYYGFFLIGFKNIQGGICRFVEC